MLDRILHVPMSIVSYPGRHVCSQYVESLPELQTPGGDVTIPGELMVPGEENQTGELQGRFAQEQSGAGIETTPDPNMMIEPAIPESPLDDTSAPAGEQPVEATAPPMKG